MHRVAVLGPGGAGKSTFSRALGAITDLPVVHLDEQHWRPGWIPTPREEWRAWQLSNLHPSGTWIADGNYSGTMDVRLSRADTVVLIVPRRAVRMYGCLRRTLGAWGRPVQAAGCPERLDLEFLRWVWRWERDTLPRVESAIAQHAGSAQVHRLRSRRDVRRFLRDVESTCGS